MKPNLENEICWIVKLICDNDSCSNTLELGPKAISDYDSCRDK